MAHAKNHDYHILSPSLWPMLGAIAGFFQFGRANVIIKVDRACVDPSGVIELKRVLGQLHAEDRDQMDPRFKKRGEVFVKRVAKALGEIVDRQPCNMHGCLFGLHVKEGCVDAAELFHDLFPVK